MDSKPTMIYDPRAILHLMLVEYRWLVLLYFTFFQLIVNTTISITNGSESEDYTDLILCTGLGKFNTIFSEALQGFLLSGDDEYTLEVDSCDPKGEPGPVGSLWVVHAAACLVAHHCLPQCSCH